MLLSKTCVNAIRATIEIAANVAQSDRKYVPVKEIAVAIDVSRHFLGKIAQILVDAGILVSYRGPNGGVGLAVPASNLTLMDIIEATDGHAILEKCLLGLPECNGKNPCPLHKTWEKSRARLIRELEKDSIASIVRRRRVKNTNPE